MKYKIQKVAVIAFGSIFIIIGAGALISALPTALHGRTNDWPIVVAGIGFTCIGFFAARQNVLRLSALERKASMTFEWFRNTYPQAVTRDRVSCTSCGASRIHVRGLMQQSYLREHFCTRCGTVLYYSPEV